MVVSLYICEIPKNVTKQDIENIFCEFDGYKETRMKGNDIDKRKIAFVDYQSESNARFALETLNGFKFSVNDKGIFIKFSDNNKIVDNQSGKSNSRYINRKRNDSKSPDSEKYKIRKKKYDDSCNYSNKKDNFEQRTNNYSNNNFNHKPSIKSFVQPNTPPNNNSFINNLGSNIENGNNSNNLNVLNDFVNIIQNAHVLNLLGNFSNSGSNINNINSSNNDNLVSSIGNFTNILGNLSTTIPNNQNNSSLNITNNFSNIINKYDNDLKKLMEFSKNVTNIVYVEGFPFETSEREISHIFRPFPGFLSVRLITREKNGEKTIICFADFENVYQSSICIYTLQGYRFDKNDLVGLHFSYGVNKQKK